jgi:tetratricopeptide (TPR) repeat protein
MAAKYPDDLWACCMAVRNKVMCLQMLGRYDESTSAARGAIERFGRSKASIGDWLPLGINTQFIMTIDIGDNLRSQKSYDKAFQEYQRARQYLDNYLNTECTSPALAAAGVLARYSLHRKLAEWYADTGQYEKAAGVCEEWIAAIGDLLTSETAHFLPNREWMILRQRLDQEIYLPKQAAGYYEKAGRPEKAKELRNRVLSVSQEAVKDGRYKSVPLFHKGVEFLLKELEKPTAVQP